MSAAKTRVLYVEDEARWVAPMQKADARLDVHHLDPTSASDAFPEEYEPRLRALFDDALASMRAPPHVLLLDIYYPRPRGFPPERIPGETADAMAPHEIDAAYVRGGLMLLDHARSTRALDATPIVLYSSKALRSLPDAALTLALQHDGTLLWPKLPGTEQPLARLLRHLADPKHVAWPEPQRA